VVCQPASQPARKSPPPCARPYTHALPPTQHCLRLSFTLPTATSATMCLPYAHTSGGPSASQSSSPCLPLHTSQRPDCSLMTYPKPIAHAGQLCFHPFFIKIVRRQWVVSRSRPRNPRDTPYNLDFSNSPLSAPHYSSTHLCCHHLFINSYVSSGS
jgi:hypothetical protein